jgi:hypothetical protein
VEIPGRMPLHILYFMIYALRRWNMDEHLLGGPILPKASPTREYTVEQIRTKYIKHEACVKSVGTLYYIAALLLFVAGIVGPIAAKEDPIVLRLAAGAFLIALGAFQFWVAVEVRKLKSWARIPVGVLSGIGLLGFPLGTVINGYILYLVFCKKGEMVFSDGYKHIIAATPQIKYRTSFVVWILLGLLVAVVVILLFAASLSR